MSQRFAQRLRWVLRWQLSRRETVRERERAAGRSVWNTLLWRAGAAVVVARVEQREQERHGAGCDARIGVSAHHGVRFAGPGLSERKDRDGVAVGAGVDPGADTLHGHNACRQELSGRVMPFKGCSARGCRGPANKKQKSKCCKFCHVQYRVRFVFGC